MAFLSNLSIKLSAEDATLFNQLQESALLPDLAYPGEGELVRLFKAKKREEEANKMEPYADLLEIELLKMLTARKESILKQLRESKDSTFAVDLFAWNTVIYSESLTEFHRRVSEMTHEQKDQHDQKLREQKRLIADNGWEDTFAVETSSDSYWDPDLKNTFWRFDPVKVDRIFRNSNLKMRLSLALGPNFFPGVRWDLLQREDGFTAYKKTLFVTYYPFGVNKRQMTLLLETAKKEAERKRLSQKTTYGESDYGIAYAGLCVLPLPKEEEVSLLGNKRCNCAVCYDEDSE